MTKEITPLPIETVPADIKEQTAEIVRDAFQLLAEQTKKMAQQVIDFKLKRQQAREKVHGPIRRTRSRIV